MRKLTVLFVFVLTLLTLSAGAARALGTPDGQPPSVETICDNLTGAAYGLCTAYCEAMDCESPDPHASATACSRVGDHFQRITGSVPPCVVPPTECPCMGDAVFSSVANQIVPAQGCLTDSNTSPTFITVTSSTDPIRTASASTAALSCTATVGGQTTVTRTGLSLVQAQDCLNRLAGSLTSSANNCQIQGE
jgi:hypothetical protein